MNALVNNRISLNITALNGEDHQAHDQFIYFYLTTELNLNEDLILIETKKLLVTQKDHKPKIVKFVAFCYHDYEERKHLENKHRLALYILLQHFPESWESIRYNAYILIIDLLYEIYDKIAPLILIFPQCWTRNIFRLENILRPEEVNGVLFGIDPLSKTTPGCTHTGHAFCFNSFGDVEIDQNYSMIGLREAYCLSKDIPLINQAMFEEQFTRKYGLALINFIRMIPERSNAGTANPFHTAWTKFHYIWLKEGLGILTSADGLERVLIFENQLHPFHKYSGDEMAKLLSNTRRCAHPSYQRSRIGHCINKPNTFSLYFDKTIEKFKKPADDSVIYFRDFMIRHNAADAIHCLCKQCKVILVESCDVENQILMEC